jgi:hypothetical protein
LAWLARAGGHPGVQRHKGLAVQHGGDTGSDCSGGLGRAGTFVLVLAVAFTRGLLEEEEGRKKGRGGERRVG